MTVSKDKTAKASSNGNGKTAATKTSNGSSNGSKATTSTKTSNGKAATKTSAKAPEESTEELTPEQVAKRIRSLIHKKYGVVIPRREESAHIPVYYAAKEKLERAINTALKKTNQTLDWNEWNTRIAPAILGQPGKLKHSPQVMAVALAQLFPGISLDPEEAVNDLTLYNERSLDKRNNRSKPEPEADEDFDLDDLDALEDDDSDSDDESDDEDDEDIDLEDDDEDDE